MRCAHAKYRCSVLALVACAAAIMPTAPALRLFVDGSIVTPQIGGIRTFTKALVEALARRPGLEITIATSDATLRPEGVRTIAISGRVASPVGRTLWREALLPRLVREAGADAVLVPFPEVACRSLGVPVLVVVHDVIALTSPATVSFARRLRWRLTMPRVCRSAQLLVVSHATLATLSRLFGVDAARCRVIGEGPGRPPAPLPPPRDTADHARDHDPYFLYAGALMAHKNVPTLIAAVARLPGARLVISGRASERELRTLRAVCERDGVADRVEHVGFVADAKLDALYRHAAAFVFPSLDEGFGLPALEAMQAGVVPIVADTTVMREVAGDAAIFVGQPLDPSAWAASMAAVQSDDDLRASLRKRGAARVARFTWEATATAVEDALRDAIARDGASDA
jgi:glycosyltransferase involved in cell wall biosynthesis